MGRFLLRHRLTISRVLMVLAGLFFISTLPQAISPWWGPTLANMDGVKDPNLHRWSAALAGAPDMGGGFVLLYLAWRPLRAPLALQWLAMIVVVFLATNLPFVGPVLVVIAIPVVLALVSHPRIRQVLTPPWSEGVNLPVLVLGAATAIVLVAGGFQALGAQIRAEDEVAANYDWAADAEHLINVGLAALLSGMRKPGANVLKVMVAAVLAFMGSAAITVPNNPGSWGPAGGALAIAVGVAFLAAAAYDWRRGRGRASAAGADRAPEEASPSQEPVAADSRS